MKADDVKPSIYINFNTGNDKEDPKFRVGGHVWIPKYKNIFAKRCDPNWSEEAFVIKKLKKLCLG